VVKSRETIEFGDFQTPLELSIAVASIVNNSMSGVFTILEPTCGIGNFLKAFAILNVPACKLVGWEINPAYVQIARKELSLFSKDNIFINEQDFFQFNWESINDEYRQPILFVGNPPWATSSELGKLLSRNIPVKSNFQGHSGLEAITGKSNFDISEWMLIKIAEIVSDSDSAMAFLVKTSVARKIFFHIAKNKLFVDGIYIREIDAKKHFGVNVDACLFFAKGSRQINDKYHCPVYSDFKISIPYKIMGIYNDKLVANLSSYMKLSDIDSGCEFKWRSGIKHDVAKIMELKRINIGYINGLGEIVDIPEDYLYPMYKSSNISKNFLKDPEKWMIVTQKRTGDNTKDIKNNSPLTWDYLTKHNDLFDSRKSSIYKKSQPFSVFGIGEYTFKPWKIVISGLYKNVHFTKIGTFEDKPVVLDDTCYMLGFDTEHEADFILKLLKSDIAVSFISSLIFKDSKRPVTVALLNRINLRAIAIRLNLEEDFERCFFNDELPLSNDSVIDAKPLQNISERYCC